MAIFHWLMKKLIIYSVILEKPDYLNFLFLSNLGIKPIDPPKKEEVKKKNDTMNGNCCECPKNKKISEIEESERMMTIYFENFLQNNVFFKRYQKLHYLIYTCLLFLFLE